MIRFNFVFNSVIKLPGTHGQYREVLLVGFNQIPSLPLACSTMLMLEVLLVGFNQIPSLPLACSTMLMLTKHSTTSFPGSSPRRPQWRRVGEDPGN